jgi:methenyltetrahydromethanopterin cyclohydrolase
VTPKFADAMARTNDAILYGGTASYVINHGNEEDLKKLIVKAPSMASRSYGRAFIEIFKEAEYNFYKIDADLFAPAVVIINSLETGSIYVGGKINAEALSRSFDLKDFISA